MLNDVFEFEESFHLTSISKSISRVSIESELCTQYFKFMTTLYYVETCTQLVFIFTLTESTSIYGCIYKHTSTICGSLKELLRAGIKSTTRCAAAGSSTIAPTVESSKIASNFSENIRLKTGINKILFH